jgi:hypothetical protein
MDCKKGDVMEKTMAARSAELVLAAGAGALLMYLLDPQQGRRRVALVRDKAIHLAREGSELTDAGTRDLAHRATGVAAGLRGALQRESPDDEVLAERVRAQMGRWTAHSRAIEVSASGGCVTLRGAVLRSEHDRLLRELAKVRGVRQIEDRLETHASAGNVPALQGGRDRSGPRMELMQRNWSAGPRLLSLAGGAVLSVYGLVRRDLGGTLCAIAGAALAARAATNTELSRALGMSGGRRAPDLEKKTSVDMGRTPHQAVRPDGPDAMAPSANRLGLDAFP